MYYRRTIFELLTISNGRDEELFIALRETLINYLLTFLLERYVFLEKIIKDALRNYFK